MTPESKARLLACLTRDALRAEKISERAKARPAPTVESLAPSARYVTRSEPDTPLYRQSLNPRQKLNTYSLERAEWYHEAPKEYILPRVLLNNVPASTAPRKMPPLEIRKRGPIAPTRSGPEPVSLDPAPKPGPRPRFVPLTRAQKFLRRVRQYNDYLAEKDPGARNRAYDYFRLFNPR